MTIELRNSQPIETVTDETVVVGATNAGATGAGIALASAIFDYIVGKIDVSDVTGAQSAADVAAAITTAINNLKGGVGTALDTLDELAAALGDDANFAATMTAALAGKMATNFSNYTTTVPNSALPERLRESAHIIADWNDALTTGWYMAINAANAPSPGIWYIGNTVSHTTDWCIQEVTAFTETTVSNTNVFRREKRGGTWSAWYKVLKSESEIIAAATGGRVKAFATVNADGTLAAGSENISSTSKLATGKYRANFTTSITNPIVVAVAHSNGGTSHNHAMVDTVSSTSIDVWSFYASSSFYDSKVSFVVLGA